MQTIFDGLYQLWVSRNKDYIIIIIIVLTTSETRDYWKQSEKQYIHINCFLEDALQTHTIVQYSTGYRDHITMVTKISYQKSLIIINYNPNNTNTTEFKLLNFNLHPISSIRPQFLIYYYGLYDSPPTDIQSICRMRFYLN